MAPEAWSSAPFAGSIHRCPELNPPPTSRSSNPYQVAAPLPSISPCCSLSHPSLCTRTLPPWPQLSTRLHPRPPLDAPDPHRHAKSCCR